MKLLIKTLVMTGLLCVSTATTQAASLSLSPNALAVQTGSTFSVDLVISGLTDSAAPSASVFDINIGFDPFALGFLSLTLETELGDTSLGDAIDVSFGVIVPGVVNVAEISFLTAAELDGSQPDSFVLATLDFMAMPGLNPGQTTAIDIIDVLALGDSNGDALVLNGTSGALVTAVIPLPGAVWFFGCAVGVLLAFRKPGSTL